MKVLRYALVVMIICFSVPNITFAQDDTVFTLVAEAYLQRANGNFEQALKLFGQAIELDPMYADAYGGRGSVYVDMQQYELALADYQIATKFESAYTGDLGYVYANLDDFEAAIEAYSRAVTFDPQNTDSYDWLGHIFGQLGEEDTAIHYFNRALGVNEYDAYALRGIGEIYYDLNNPLRALPFYDRSIQIEPSLSAFHNRGLIYSDLFLYEKALIDFNYVLKHEPNAAYAYGNRGIVYSEMEQEEQAIADYNRAIALDPNDPRAYYNRGVSYSRLDMAVAAEADFLRAVEIDPNFEIPYLILASISIDRSDYVQAQIYYDRFMQISHGVVDRQFVSTKQYVVQALQDAQQTSFDARTVAIVALLGIAGFLVYRIQQTHRLAPRH